MKISFSPPDISQEEIDEVIDTLKSGWITTGPKTKLFERKISEYCNTPKSVCLNSATAAMEMTLRLLGIGPGDEVITSAYTYTASASVIHHVGAKIILVDTAKDSYEMDYEKLGQAITSRTKAVIPVDIAGVMCDYDKLFDEVNKKKELFKPSNDIQKAIGRVAILADAAHSFGATYKSKHSGEVADFTCFSFHAVKNLTTAEGGAVTWLDIEGIDNEEIYKKFMLLALHGQDKDALAKTKPGAWEYNIVYPAYKCNMTDIMASLGLAQLKRYPEILKRRREIIDRYNEGLKDLDVSLLKHYGDDFKSSEHLYLIRLNGKDEDYRNSVIEKMAEIGIATNVHYKPLPMHTAYKNLGFDIKDYPNAFDMYRNGMTLPLHTLLSDEDIDYVCGGGGSNYIGIIDKLEVNIVIEYKLLNFEDFSLLMEDFIALYNRCFSGIIYDKFIDWRYIKNPLNELLIAAAFDDKRLIGIYAASPIIINIDGSLVQMAESLNTMTDPEYSGKGIFKTLAQLLYDDMKDKDYVGILGFPNFLSNPTFEKRLGWETISEIPTLEYNIKDNLNNIIYKKSTEDNEFNLNYSNCIKNKNKLYLNKTREFLKWRYFRNPKFNYINFVVTENSDIVKSYMVVKEYEDEVNILDYYINSQDDFEELINNVYKFAINNSLLKITTWSQFGSNEHYYFQKKRFKNTSPVVYFGARFFKNAHKDLYNYKNWNVRMGDCNIY